MQHVRRADTYNFDIRMIDRHVPISCPVAEAKRFNGLVDPFLQIVADDDQLRVVVTLWEQRRNAEVRARVGLAHPAEADHGHADLLAGHCGPC